MAAALSRRYSEIRRLTEAFQQAALPANHVDGVYGPLTRAALSYWIERTAPRPWAGSGTRRYRHPTASPTDGTANTRAVVALARTLYQALLEPEGDARALLERFQRTVGLTVDGKYGRQSRAALGRLGVRNPPRSFRRSRARGSRGSASRARRQRRSSRQRSG